jgi:fructoselysine-6-P-deglycase FrlB-like protein
MSLTIASASARIRRQLIGCEHSVAGALSQTSELIATLARAQVDVPEAPRGAGQVAIMRAQAASRKLAEAQAELLRSHDQLVVIGREMMSPEETTCPPSGLSEVEITNLDKQAA